MELSSYIHIPTLLFFLTIWVGTYVYSKDKHKFDRDGTASSIHSIIVVLLASSSLLFQGESTVSESVPLTFSCSYFLVDLLDCIVRLDSVFTFHAILSLFLNVCCHRPDIFAWRGGSRAYMTEISTPFYNRWKLTKTKADFVILCVIFFLCRIVWVPIFLWGMYFRQSSPAEFDLLMVASLAFYVLQLAFFAKMVNILMNYGGSKKKRKKAM